MEKVKKFVNGWGTVISFVLVILIFLTPKISFGLIEVDITRGNLNPLPVAVSPLFVEVRQNVISAMASTILKWDVAARALELLL